MLHQGGYSKILKVMWTCNTGRYSRHCLVTEDYFMACWSRELDARLFSYLVKFAGGHMDIENNDLSSAAGCSWKVAAYCHGFDIPGPGDWRGKKAPWRIYVTLSSECIRKTNSGDYPWVHVLLEGNRAYLLFLTESKPPRMLLNEDMKANSQGLRDLCRGIDSTGRTVRAGQCM